MTEQHNHPPDDDAIPVEVDDPDYQPEGVAGEEIEGDFPDVGIRMLEIDSYERIIDGLKIAAEGCRALGQWNEDGNWDVLVTILDQLRFKLADASGFDRPNDKRETAVLHEITTLSIRDAYLKVSDGLRMSSDGARQMGACHRGEVKWALCGAMIYNLRDKASELLKMRGMSHEYFWNM